MDALSRAQLLQRTLFHISLSCKYDTVIIYLPMYFHFNYSQSPLILENFFLNIDYFPLLK